MRQHEKEVRVFPKGYVTLYTDSSRHEDGLMSWSYWARHDNGRITSYGMCPEILNSIDQGEMYAICQGMHHILKQIPDVKGFYVTSDSIGAISILKNKYKERSTNGKKRADGVLRLKLAFDKMVEKHGLVMDIRHVKGHSGTRYTRGWLNDWCDKAAAKAIKEHRQKMNQNKRDENT